MDQQKLIPNTPQDDTRPSRREFLESALTVSTLAASGLLDLPVAADAPVPIPQAPPAASPIPLQIGEIASADGSLRAVISIKHAERTMPGAVRTVRYFEGKDRSGKLIWPPPASPGVVPPPLPGPTLRARVGDQVEITFLNHVDASALGAGFDNVERGVEGCQSVVVQSDGLKLYPQAAQDTAPNCFHGSSTANLHFHGTHVTPDGLGDNVLLQLRPESRVTEVSVRRDFEQIFKAGPPASWSQLPESWRRRQLELLREYDREAPWKTARGLPRENQLRPPTVARINAGLWPQYQVGAYPYCFKLTEYHEDASGNPLHYKMGQCPGTHWYHAHKHGSTAINVYNGMAGVFIIEGDYDEALKGVDERLKLNEKVFIIQNFSDVPNLMRRNRVAPGLWTNGQSNPRISMQPGEIQLWRFVNASVRAVCSVGRFTEVNGHAPEVRQIAQDGVQFRFENYEDGAQPILSRAHVFAPGNRMDLLVQAPSAAGGGQEYTFNVTDTTNNITSALLTLEVKGPAIQPPMQFPTKDNYPRFPRFLNDITDDEVRIVRTLKFGWEAGRPGPGGGNGDPAPRFMIDGRQFGGDRYDQTMVLGDTEEWKLINGTTLIAHPFHIHVNPFQVVEIYDPAVGTPYAPKGNYAWQDVIAVPPRGPVNGTGDVKDGYVRIRHRFVDFPGSYVLHCHMLAHEDRGMMQLVRVIPAGVDLLHH